jgi:polysaccharide export outer membrane protein
MKKALLFFAIALAFTVQGTSAHAQSNNIAPASNDKQPISSKVEGETNPADQKSGKQDKSASSSTTASAAPLTPTGAEGVAATSDAPSKTMTSVPSGASAPTQAAAIEEPKTNLTPAAMPPTSIYRVGIGDVLDIRLLNAQNRESTLYSVMAGGLLEYPLAGEPLPVAGLTTDEIDARLTAQIKVFENPQVVVSVREYASHTVIVTGMVNDPGTKVLRREAMPLYVVLAEAQLKPEAGRATIIRADGQSLEVNLKDPKATTTLVLPGDVISLTTPPPAPPQFFYVGGQVNSPGQKDFHQGLTLTQAVLASGGTTRFAGSKVKVSRQGSDGKLVVTEYNLKQIEGGKIPDPVLQPGDRLEVGRGSW